MQLSFILASQSGVICGHLGFLWSLFWALVPSWGASFELELSKMSIFLWLLAMCKLGFWGFNIGYVPLHCAMLASSWVLLGPSGVPFGLPYGHLGVFRSYLGALMSPLEFP